jgi:acylglycerol lipase
MATHATTLTEAWLEGPLSTKFYTRFYAPPANTPTRAVLVFIHGYIDYINHYSPTHEAWAEHGIAVFAWDQRGFGLTALGPEKSPSSSYGRTGGHKERMADVEWAVDQARQRVGRLPVFIMGFSMVSTPWPLVCVTRTML